MQNLPHSCDRLPWSSCRGKLTIGERKGHSRVDRFLKQDNSVLCNGEILFASGFSDIMCTALALYEAKTCDFDGVRCGVTELRTTKLTFTRNVPVDTLNCGTPRGGPGHN